jgi:hypothetical protein
MQASLELFQENPNSTNYNYVISTMLVYQYWNQKATKEFILTEEF